MLNFAITEFSEGRSNGRYDGLPYSPSSPRPSRRGAPPRAAHPHPAVPDDPGNVRFVLVVEDCVKHPLSEGGSYRLAPVTDVATVRAATAPEVHAHTLILPAKGRGMHVVGVGEGLRRELSLDAVYFTRHVCAEVEVRWVIRNVRSADRPLLTRGWCQVFKLEGCDLGLDHLTLFLDDALKFFFRGRLYLVRSNVDWLGNFRRLRLLGPIDRGVLQRLIVPLTNIVHDILPSLGRGPSLFGPLGQSFLQDTPLHIP